MTYVIQAALRRPLNLSDLASVATAKVNLSLDNVDNTSDVNKPVSTAQAAADAAVLASSSLVHTTGNETVAGNKRFSNITYIGANDSAIFESTNLYLQGDLSDYIIYDKAGNTWTFQIGGVTRGSLNSTGWLDAAGSLLMSRSAVETVSGAKTFSAGPILNNNVVFYGKESGGTQRELLQVNTSNFAQFGDVNIGALYKGSSHSFNTTPLVGSDPIATRGAAETFTGAKTMSAASLIMRGDTYGIIHQESGGTQRWITGIRSDLTGNTTDVVYYSNSVGVSMQGFLSTGIFNFAFGLRVAGKQALSHAGAYTSGQVTYSTSAASGGSDGDMWVQYV